MLHRLRQKGFTVRVFESRQGRRRHLVLEPLSRRALRRRKRAVFLPVLARAAAGMGVDASATPPSPRSCATPTTSPTASTCAATSSSRRGSPRPRSTRRRHAWTVETDNGDRVTARFCITAMGCLSSPNTPQIPGPRRFQGPDLSHRQLAARGRRFHRQARGRDRHRLVGDPVDPDHRPAGQAPHRVPAHGQLHRAGAQHAARSGLCRARSRPTTPPCARRAKAMPAGIDFAFNPASAIETRQRPSASASTRSAGTTAASASWASFNDLLLNEESNKTAADFVRAKIHEMVTDPELAEKLTPTQRHRLQAAVRRHRLLRDLQPAERHAGRRERRADRAHHGRRACGPRARTTASTAWCWPPASTP